MCLIVGKALIKQMISIDPLTRPTFDTLLHTSRGSVFPECFYSFLHNYVSSVNEVNTPSLFSTTPASAIPPSATLSVPKGPNAAMSSSGALNGESPSDPLPSDSDHRMERIWADYESVEPYLINEATEEMAMDVKVDYTPQFASSRPFHVRMPVACFWNLSDFSLRTCFLWSSTFRTARANCTVHGLQESERQRKVCPCSS